MVNSIIRKATLFHKLIRNSVVITFVLVGGLTACICLFAPADFAGAYLSNLLATIAGVVLGIPTALYIAHFQEKETEKERKKRILNLLKKELDNDAGYIFSWKGRSDQTGPDEVNDSEISIFLRDDVWKAFADGGELQWIKDPDLLEQLSIAYFQIGAIKELSSRYFNLISMRRNLGRHEFINAAQEELQKGAEAFLEHMKELEIIWGTIFD